MMPIISIATKIQVTGAGVLKAYQPAEPSQITEWGVNRGKATNAYFLSQVINYADPHDKEMMVTTETPHPNKQDDQLIDTVDTRHYESGSNG
ncbi:hypothetical protein D1831_09200 [Lactiplantibacillus garii]|uniref:Uncharacterized protein n=1 Tax=Lactiplantibacillus garii TaxID=2306423 RepID=A0A426D6T0_9LACO|nr:hypothetical protein [Lactiplantibacillus garii]RRK10129.1 hypothetical protein D1831_09200 [Lactiplantibacillus garii]